MFETRGGFERCEDARLEEGFLKIALYATGREFHHVAKQLPSGAWSSKIGKSIDIRHETLESLLGCVYFADATPTVFMRRPYDGTDDFELEETGLITI